MIQKFWNCTLHPTKGKSLYPSKFPLQYRNSLGLVHNLKKPLQYLELIFFPKTARQYACGYPVENGSIDNLLIPTGKTKVDFLINSLKVNHLQVYPLIISQYMKTIF